ncbi:MAG TPA: proline dehydrogenase family protein [Gemmatimonadaceae bacterium]|nr:proline dehydrogenase family protein [Gemmatimonadaceae bacterium]
MSIARTLLLRASRSTWLAEQFRRRSFARRAVRRFMPGEDLGSALDAAATFGSSGLGSVVTALGERVSTRAEAEGVRRHYIDVLDAIAARRLPTHISVKLTHLGLDVDRALCLDSVRALAVHAAATRTMLWVDMEESHYIDATLDLYRTVLAEHPGVGVCLQAYLHRTPTDLESLLAAGASIRLVKGAYREPPEVAFPRKADTDAAYLTLAHRMLDSAATNQRQVFGTHDLGLLERIRVHAASRSLPGNAWEVHMLYGIEASAQRALAAGGVSVRVLISYGSHWFPWYVRRLAERPANVWFVVRSLIPRSSSSSLGTTA